MTVTQTAPNGQNHVESLPLFLLCKQLQDLHIDVSLLSGIHLKSHERVFNPNYHFYGANHFPGRKGGTAVAVRKAIPHNHVNPPPLVSIEATGLPIDNSEVLLAAVYKSPTHAWNDADIIELLHFKHKSLLTGYLNTKYPLWNT
jgi:hypothetical protein